MKKLVFVAAAVAASLVTPTFAADLPVKAPQMVAAPAPWSWTGFYVGGNLGYSWGRTETDATVGGTALSDSLNVNGIIGGGQIGYNWQTGNFVLGVETDFQGSGQKGDNSLAFSVFIPGVGLLPVTEPYESKLTYFGTVRGRVGYAFDHWLVYATGGWAYGHETLDATATIGGTSVSTSYSTNRSGWTAGGGVEMALDRNWSVKAEYLYIDLGDWGITSSSGGLTSTSTVKFTDNIFRLGVNYRF